MTVSILDIGAIRTTPYNFAVSRDSSSGTKGFRGVTFSGMMEQALADSLDELVVNPAARVTKGGVTGVQEYVVAQSAALVNYTGYYLLLGFDSSPDGIDPNWPYVSFSLKAVLLGDLP